MVRIGVIGGGRWGPNLIRNFYDHQQCEVMRIAEIDGPRRPLLAQRYPRAEVVADPDLVLEDPRIDAVVIATPTITHYELTRRALAAGKHVLVEKPLTSASAQAEELVELAARRKLVLMVGHVFLFNDAVRSVKRFVERGDLGRIYYMAMVRTNLGPIRMDVNAAWDLAAHDISIANYWLGTSAVRVSATGHSWINPGIEDAIFATLRYPNDVLVNLHCSWLSPCKARTVTVTGTRRMLTFDDMDAQEPVRIFDSYVDEEPSKAPLIDSMGSFRASLRNGDITIPRVTLGEPLANECNHFVECVADGKPSLCDGRVGADVVHVLAAIERSIRANGVEQEVGA